MAKTLEIILEFSEIEDNWDFIINGLIPVALPDVDILDLEIKILRATTNLKETDEKIKKVKDNLELIDDIDLKEKDINNLYTHMKRITRASEEMKEKVAKFKESPNYPNISHTIKGTMYYTDVLDARVNLSITEYISPISDNLDKIISIFSKYAAPKNTERTFSMSDAKSDSEKIKELETTIAAIKKENTKKEGLIEGLMKKITGLESEKDTTKQDSENKLKEIEEIKRVSGSTMDKMLEEGQEFLKAMKEKRAKIITLDITKTLYDKKKASATSLIVATILYVSVLLLFFIYSLNLVFGDSGWVARLPDITDFAKYISTRILLISPFVLFIFLAAQYYNRAFRRSEYYASKYIIASSIEAFKNQMEYPEYKDAIASAVFSELLLDPADYIDRAEKRKKEKESVIASLIDRIKGKATEDIDIKAELEKLVGEIEKLKATKDGTPPA